jgi:hypothetical protein
MRNDRLLGAILGAAILLAFLFPAWAGRIAYQGQLVMGVRSVVVMNDDGSSAAPMPAVGGEPGEGDIITPSLSPDGKFVAFAAKVAGRFKIFAAELGAGNRPIGPARQLTSGAGHDEQPAWSPNGKKLSYVSHEDKTVGLFVMNADGSGAAKVADLSLNFRDACPAWSPDGTRIAYSNEGALWIVPADGGQPEKLGDDVWFPSWSHDGKQIACFRREPWPALTLLSVDGAKRTILVPKVGEPGETSWSPDGSSILFKARSIGPREGNLWIADVATGRVRPVKILGTAHAYLDWSAGPAPRAAAVVAKAAPVVKKAVPRPAQARGAEAAAARVAAEPAKRPGAGARPAAEPAKPPAATVKPATHTAAPKPAPSPAGQALAGHAVRVAPSSRTRGSAKRVAARPKPGPLPRVTPAPAPKPVGETAPLVEIVSPPNGAIVRGKQEIVARKKDDQGYVVFHVTSPGEGPVAPEFKTATVSPFRFIWDTRGAPDGEHIVRAAAYDSSNQLEGETEVRLIVRNILTEEALGKNGVKLRLMFTAGQHWQERFSATAEFAEKPQPPDWTKTMTGRLEVTLEHGVDFVDPDGSSTLSTRIERSNLTLAGTGYPMPEADKSARFTTGALGRVAVPPERLARHRIGIGELGIVLTEKPVKVGSTWSAPMTYIADLVTREVHETAAIHKVELAQWVYRHEAVRIKSTATVRELVLPNDVRLYNASFTRTTWFAYKAGKVLAMEDSIQGEARLPQTGPGYRPGYGPPAPAPGTTAPPGAAPAAPAGEEYMSFEPGFSTAASAAVGGAGSASATISGGGAAAPSLMQAPPSTGPGVRPGGPGTPVTSQARLRAIYIFSLSREVTG